MVEAATMIGKRQSRSSDDGGRLFRPARALLLMLLAVLIGGTAVWGVRKLQDPELLPLKVVRIDGGFQHLKREDVQRVLEPHLRRGFFAIDVAAIRTSAEDLPWVDRVSVRLVWPDTLRLSVTEQVPLARWQEGRLLNVRGQVFRPPATEIPPGLPVFAGPEGSELEIVGRYRDLNARLDSLGMAVQQITLDARRAWTLKTDNGLVVRLGKKDIEMRLARFFRIYPLLQRKQLQLQEVDLRYTNGFAIRKKADNGEGASPKVGMGWRTPVLGARGLA